MPICIFFTVILYFFAQLVNGCVLLACFIAIAYMALSAYKGLHVWKFCGVFKEITANQSSTSRFHTSQRNIGR